MSAGTGAEMKLYYNSATVASPTWVELDEVGDVNLPDFTRGLAELKRRANQFTKNFATRIQSIALEFRLIHGLDATAFAALRTAFLAGTPMQFAIMNGPIATAGSEGWTLPMLVENFPWDQNLEDVSGHDIRLAVAYMTESSTEVDPEWLTVSE